MAEAAVSKPFDFKGTIMELVKRAGSDLHIKVGRLLMLRIWGNLVELNCSPSKPDQLKALA